MCDLAEYGDGDNRDLCLIRTFPVFEGFLQNKVVVMMNIRDDFDRNTACAGELEFCFI